jgi:hypothetical protein
MRKKVLPVLCENVIIFAKRKLYYISRVGLKC